MLTTSTFNAASGSDNRIIIVESTMTGPGGVNINSTTNAGGIVAFAVNAKNYGGDTNVNNGAILRTDTSNVLPTGTTVNFSGTSTLNLGATSQTVASLGFPTTASSNTTITGAGGTLIVNGATNLQFGPGGVGLASTPHTQVDMSGLSNFEYNAPGNSFRVGLKAGTTNTAALGQVATVTLANDNTITASQFLVGDVQANSDGGSSTLHLGQSNIINANTIRIADSGRSDASLDFAAPGSSVTLRGTNGVAPVGTFAIGRVTQFASGTAQQDFTASVDFSNGSIDGLVTNMLIADANTTGANSRAGSITGSFSMGSGTLDVTNLTIGQIQGAGTIGANYTANGTFTLENAGGTLTAGTINLATNTITATGAFTKTVSGTLEVNAGNVIANTIQLGPQTGSANNVTANLFVDGGSVTAGGMFNIDNVRIGDGSTTGSLTLNGGSANTAGVLVSQSNSATANILTLGPADSLTLTGGGSGNVLAVGNSSTSTPSNTRLNISGASAGVGSLVINNASGDISVNQAIPAGGSGFGTAVLDMTGLDSFQATINEFRIATGSTRTRGQVTLADNSNVITADAIVAGSQSGTTTNLNFLRLGQSNTLHADKIVVGGARLDSTLEFRSDLSGPLDVTIRGKAGGSSRADIWLGDQGGNSGYGGGGSSTAVGVMDLTAGSVDARIGTLMVGRNGATASNNSGAAIGTFSFDEGMVDVTSVFLGRTPALSGNLTNFSDPLTQGTLNMGGGTLIAGSMVLGQVEGSSSSYVASSSNAGTRATGTFNLSGGNATVTGNLTLAHHPNGGAVTATGIVNITGGSLTVGGNIVEGTGGATSISELTLDGGLLDMTGGSITVDTFNLQSGTLQNVAQVTAGGNNNFSKTTGGQLILQGSNAFTGVLTVVDGSARLQSVSALGSTSGRTDVSGGSTSTGVVELIGGLTYNAETLRLGARQNSAINNVHLRNVSGNNIWTGDVELTTGGSDYNIESAGGTLELSGGIVASPNSGTRQLNLFGDSDGEFTGAIAMNPGAGSNTLRKYGTGTWTIEGGISGVDAVQIDGGTLVSGDNNLMTNQMLAGSFADEIVINDGGSFKFFIRTGVSPGPYDVPQLITVTGDAANSAGQSQIRYDPQGGPNPNPGGDRRIDLSNIQLDNNAVLGVSNDESSTSGGRLGLTLLSNATLTADGGADDHDLLSVSSSGGARTLSLGQTSTLNTQLFGVSDGNTTLAVNNANLTMDPVGTGADINGSISVNSGSSWTVTSDWTFDGNTANVNTGGTMTGESVTVDGATFDVSGGIANIQSFHLINGAQGGVSNGGTLNILGNTTTVNGGSTLFITDPGTNLNESMDLIVADGAGQAGFVDQNTGGNATVNNSTIIGRNGGNGDWTAAAGSGTISLGTGEATDNFHLGVRNNSAAAASVGTADFSGASSVTIDVEELFLGVNDGGGNAGTTQGILTLSGGPNSVTADTLLMGSSDQNGNASVTSQLTLGGSTNDFNVDNFTIAGNKSVGTVSIVAGGSFDLTGTAGAGTGTLDLSRRGVNTAENTLGTLDLTAASSVTIDVDTIRLGTIAVIGGTNTSGGDSQGIWNFSNTFNDISADDIIVGDSPQPGNTDVTSTITLGSGTNNVNVDTFTIGGTKSNGSVTMNAGGVLTLAGNDNAAANLLIADNNVDTGTETTGSLNVSAGTFNGTLNQVVIGRHGPGSGNAAGTLTMGAGTVTASSVALAVDTGSDAANTFGTLNMLQNGASFNVSGNVTDGAGVGTVNIEGGTMNVTGNFTVDNLNIANTNTDNAVALLNVDGAVNVGTGSNTITIGGRTGGTNNGNDVVGTADFAGASAVTMNVAQLNIGVQTGGTSINSQGILLLSTAGTNTINANGITVGDSPGSGNNGPVSQIVFGGANNNVNVNSWTLGGRKSDATATITAGGTLTLSGNADLFIADNNADTGTAGTGHLNLTGGTFNAALDEVVIGRHGAGAGQADGILTMTAGTVTANSVILGNPSASGTSTAPGNTSGTINLNGGSFTTDSLNAGVNQGVGTINIAAGQTFKVNDNASTSGSFNVNGPGTLDVDDSLLIAVNQLQGTMTAGSGAIISIGTGDGSDVIDVGRRTDSNPGNYAGVLDLRNAASFTTDVQQFRVGTTTTGDNAETATGEVFLSNGTNNIQADVILVGDSPASGQESVTSRWHFGSGATTLNSTSITFGGQKSDVEVDAAGGSIAFAGNPNLFIGNNAISTGTNPIANVDLSGATLSGSVTNVLIGAHNEGAGSGQGSFTMNAGTFTANNVTLGAPSQAGANLSTNPLNTQGTVNVNGGTFTVNDSLIVGLNGGIGAFNATAGSTVNVGNGGAGDNLFIGRRTQDVGTVAAAQSASTMNLSGAANFNFNGNQLGVGTVVSGGSGQTFPNGTLLLAANNVITANTILAGESPGVGLGGNVNRIGLGASNTINANTIVIGGSKGVGLLDFQAPGGTLTLNGTAGPGNRADLLVGVHDDGVGTGAGANGTANLNGGTVSAEIDQLVVGRKPNIATGATNGNFSFNGGTINANSVDLGVRSTAGTAGTVQGIVTLSGTGNLIVNSDVNVGDATSTVAGDISTFNLQGAAILDFADHAGANQDVNVGNPTSSLNIASASIFNFDGGTLMDATFVNPNSSTVASDGVFTQAGGNFVVGRNGAQNGANAVTTTVLGAYTQNGGLLSLDIVGQLDNEIDMLLVEGDVFMNGGINGNLNNVDVIPFQWYNAVKTMDNEHEIILGGDFGVSGGLSFFRVIDNPNGPGQILQIAVPEPASVLLWSLLAAGLALYARRRRKLAIG